MKNSSQSKPSVASAVLVLILAASGFNLAVTKGQDSKRPVTSLNGTNIWTAPLRAARKPNPVPADATAIDQGKTLFSMACVPCHGPSGRGDGPSSSALERNGEKILPGNLSDPKMWSQSDGA